MRVPWFFLAGLGLATGDEATDGATAREGKADRTHFNKGNNGGGGGSSGYGPPADSYGGGGSSGYGEPSGGGYGAPCDGYGCGGGGQPVYVYQATQAPGKFGGNGGLAALIPAAGLALLAPLALFGLITTLFPTATIVGGGRRRRDVSDNTTLSMKERQAATLQTFILDYGLEQETSLQQDMVAKYLQCTDTGPGAASFPGCLEQLACIYNDKSITISNTEREVASVVLNTIVDNQFIEPGFKKRLVRAGKMGHTQPGSCHVFKCQHKLLLNPYRKPSKKRGKNNKKYLF